MHARDDLVVDNLRVWFGHGARRREVIHGVSFELPAGSSFGLIGESGSGKSLTCRSILRLLPPGGSIGGHIRYGGVDLAGLGEGAMRAYRGSRIGMIFQDPLTALNPVMRVGDAIAQVIAEHGRIGTRPARSAAVEMMERVGILDAARRAHDYPHQFSGGMRQRIVIAMALAAQPTLLLADEPTTALDVIIQAEILRLIDRLRRDRGMSLLLVSHDLGVVASVCEQIGVMYAGELVEIGPTQQLLASPRHPYTRGLLESLPEAGDQGRLRPIPGAPPDPAARPSGCAFAPRCRLATEECRRQPIPLIGVDEHRASRCIHVQQLAEAVHG
ncbi:MAG TPA: ABC transporter ATP-binding protein [Chloroflexota bacterium]|nr:ABC transporter ATP-binding protein [Chloroflexota bacterium]